MSTETTTQTPSQAVTPTTTTPEEEGQLGDTTLRDTTDVEDTDLFDAAQAAAFDREEGDEAPAPNVPGATPAPTVPVPPVQMAPAVVSPGVDPAAPPAVAPPTPAAPVPPAIATPQQVPLQQPASVPQQQVPEQPQAPAAQPTTLTNVVEQLQAQRGQVIDALSQHYALDTTQAEALAADPAAAFPKLAAQVHVNAVSAALHYVGQQLPTIIMGLLEARDRSTQQESRFYQAWPQLDRAKHDGTVRKIAQLYRQLNPNATEADFTRHVGAQAVVALGLLQPGAGTVPQAQAAPIVQAPFVPAAVSAPAVRGAPQQPNPFAAMNELLLREDG